ncbi:MAG: hypothetical protein KGO83_00925, partial [Paenibacillaceae bacterium]|nr:hypothetical protein [Paenibacillaceae bacterium]
MQQSGWDVWQRGNDDEKRKRITDAQKADDALVHKSNAKQPKCGWTLGAHIFHYKRHQYMFCNEYKGLPF